MDDDILIEVKLDDREITRQINTLASKLQKSLNVALGGNASGGNAGGATRAIRDQESAALRLAQAQARLATAGGNLTGAQNILSTALAKTSKETIATLNAQTQLARINQQAERATRQSATSVSSLAGAFTAATAVGAVAITVFTRIGRAALDAAIDIDRQVSSLTALTGSAAAAEKRFAALVAIAQKTPGLTTSLAATLDAQLRVFDVNVKTIDKLLPVIGRLNAIAPLADPRQFVNNLTQLISQNFERQDLKELVGQSPIAGQLIKQIFNVDNPTNAEAIRASAKRLGVTTVERFAEELIKAGENNSALKNAVETLGGQFDKLQDRLNVALAPLGKEFAKILIPIFDDLIKQIEKFSNIATVTFRDSKNDVIALAREMGNLATQIGKVVNEALQLVGAGSFRDFVRETASLLATAGDLLSGDFTGTRTKAIELQFLRDDARAQSDAAQRARVNARFPSGVTIDDLTSFLRTPPTPSRSARSQASAGSRPRKVEKTPVDLLFFAQSRQIDIAAQQRAIDDATDRLAKEAIQAGDTERQGRLEQGRLSRAALTQALDEREEALKRQIEAFKQLPPVLSESERFMRGFNSAIETTGDAFDRLGQSVANSFRNVGNLLDNLKRSVLDFFNDLLGQSLQRLVGQVLGPIAGFALPGGGNLFRTPSFAGTAGGLAQAFGGGISAPPSISQNQQFQQALQDLAGPATRPRRVTGTIGSAASSGFSFGAIGRSLGAAAPFLGLSIGSSLGGQSRFGQIAGLAGGAIAGTAVAASLGLVTSAPILAALPFAAPLAIPLLVGAIFAGKAAQRKKDEEASGQFLTQALQGIETLATAITTGQIEGSQARQIFETQIIGTFEQQIRSLKTKSVVESRLKNQVRDLEGVYQSRITPLIDEQTKRRNDQARFAAFDSRLIPQFATGGITQGGLAFLHDREMVLTQAHQRNIKAIAGPDVFERVGVPGVNPSRIFDDGGIMPSFGGQSSGPATINLIVQLGMSQSGAQEILASAVDSRTGQRILVNALENERTRRN